jgi:hypothetical protein
MCRLSAVPVVSAFGVSGVFRVGWPWYVAVILFACASASAPAAAQIKETREAYGYEIAFDELFEFAAKVKINECGHVATLTLSMIDIDKEWGRPGNRSKNARMSLATVCHNGVCERLEEYADRTLSEPRLGAKQIPACPLLKDQPKTVLISDPPMWRVARTKPCACGDDKVNDLIGWSTYDMLISPGWRF